MMRGIGRISRLGKKMKRAMTGDVARWIRRWLQQNGLETIGGSGEGGWGNIGTMQSDVMMANLSENLDAKPLVVCFLDDFVPERTEVMLQSRKSIAYVDLGK